MRAIQLEGAWYPDSFGGFRILLNGTTYMLCHDYGEAEREISKLRRCLQALWRHPMVKEATPITTWQCDHCGSFATGANPSREGCWIASDGKHSWKKV